MSDLDRKLLSTTDAKVWAEAFVAEMARRPYIAHDPDIMITWFANAIETGRMAGASWPT